MGMTIRRIALLTLTGLGTLVAGGGAARADFFGSKPAVSSRVELKGSRIIACCCAAPCPCRINKPPMHCHGCDYTTAVRIDRGYLGKIRMDGVAFVITGRAFSEKPADNWAYVYVSDRATAAQVKALQGMMEEGGKALGDREKYIAGTFLGMRQVPMTYSITDGGRGHNATIPGVLELKTRSVILPGRTQPARSTGILDDYGDGFIHADCQAHTYRDARIDRDWDLTGRQANQAGFTMTSQRLAKGDIGWGCWSAHADLGTKDKYQEQLVGHEKKSCCDKK
jgi:hypothetical protein